MVETIQLIFSGDLAPVGRIEQVCKENQQEKFIRDIIPIFKSADLHISNLECPITKSEKTIDKSGPSIKAHPDTISLLKSLNIGLACLANNHMKDYGNQGVLDTIAACKNNGILTVGAGKDKSEASEIQYLTIKEKTLAFINYCEEEFSIAEDKEAGSNHLDLIQAYYDIREAKRKAGIVFVIVHGGHEEYPLPSPRIKEIFHFLAELGADAVIGHHPHVVSGIEHYKGIPLVYSLGNFIFDEPENSFPGWYIGALARITIRKDNSIELDLQYIEQSREQLGISLLTGEKLEESKENCKKLSGIIQDDNEVQSHWNRFANRYQPGILKQVLNFNKFERALFKLGLFKSYLIKKNDLLPLLNIIQCEAHRDTLIYSLKNQIKSL